MKDSSVDYTFISTIEFFVSQSLSDSVGCSEGRAWQRLQRSKNCGGVGSWPKRYPCPSSEWREGEREGGEGEVVYLWSFQDRYRESRFRDDDSRDRFRDDERDRYRERDNRRGMVYMIIPGHMGGQ